MLVAIVKQLRDGAIKEEESKIEYNKDNAIRNCAVSNICEVLHHFQK